MAMMPAVDNGLEQQALQCCCSCFGLKLRVVTYLMASSVAAILLDLLSRFTLPALPGT